MRKVNYYHQEILDQIKAYELDFDVLRKNYGLKYVVKLFKYLLKQTKLKKEKISLIYPSNLSEHGNFIDELKEAGLKIKTWNEDFIDEDTGEVVSIPNHALKPLN